MANQYTGQDTREYNGWKNRSSWLLPLWRSNEERWQKAYERIVDRVAGVVGPSSTAEAGWKEVLSLYRIVYDVSAKADGCIWKNVDWETLKQHFLEEVEDAKGASNA